MRLPARRVFQGLNDDLLDLGITYFAWRPRPGFIVESFQTSFQKSPAPLTHHAQRAAQLASNCLIVQSLGTRQHNPSPSCQKRLAPRTVRQRLQPLLLL